MTGTLDRRLARLEAAAGVATDLPMIFVRFVSPDGADPPAATVTINGDIWQRAPGEMEETFLERARGEASRSSKAELTVGLLE